MDRRVCLLIATVLVSLCASVQARETRTFEFHYRMLASELPTHAPVDIYIPLPVEDDDQRILAQQIRSSIAGQQGTEMRFNNGFYHIHRPANINNPIDADLRWTVERREAGDLAGALSPAEREMFLAANQLVPVGHEVLDPILAEIRAARADNSPAATSRAIYDWVTDNVEYKKVGTGWGNGDTFWACSERYGNCTDFHALFISLARSEGIPARFEIGFPVPESRASGEIAGYHCWVRVYLPGRGWVPIDASEAAKDPARRELFYGTQPTDRIHFTTGRDLVLTSAGERQPLNYFIYPYVEVGGVPWRAELETEFSFRELAEN